MVCIDICNRLRGKSEVSSPQQRHHHQLTTTATYDHLHQNKNHILHVYSRPGEPIIEPSPVETTSTEA